MPYSAMYTLLFPSDKAVKAEEWEDNSALASHMFRFNSEKIRTVPYLLGSFEPRTNIYD